MSYLDFYFGREGVNRPGTNIRGERQEEEKCPGEMPYTSLCHFIAQNKDDKDSYCFCTGFDLLPGLSGSDPGTTIDKPRHLEQKQNCTPGGGGHPVIYRQ